MDLQCFPVNFCTDFPLKVKYSDVHIIYITIPKQSLDIYILHPSLLVVMCHRFSSVLGIYIYLCDRFSKFVLFHDTWSESLTTLSESQYVYQENYHSMVQCAALNCTIKSGQIQEKYGQYVWKQTDFSQVSTQNFVRDISRRISLLSIQM
jgi:hypothetical protein